MGMPPIPPYEGLHPIVVHFPIGILLIAWVPMLVAMVVKKQRHAWLASAALLLVLGTLAAFAAVLTGEAAEEIVAETSQVVGDALHEHEETAELARTLFVVVSMVFLAAWGVASKINPKRRGVAASVGGVLVAIVYGFASLALINAGHQGGVLVHVHGVHAPLSAPDAVAMPPAAREDPEHHEEGDD